MSAIGLHRDPVARGELQRQQGANMPAGNDPWFGQTLGGNRRSTTAPDTYAPPNFGNQQGQGNPTSANVPNFFVGSPPGAGGGMGNGPQGDGLQGGRWALYDEKYIQCLRLHSTNTTRRGHWSGCSRCATMSPGVGQSLTRFSIGTSNKMIRSLKNMCQDWGMADVCPWLTMRQA